MADPLVEVMKTPECRPLLDRLRKQLERGGALTGRCQLKRLTSAQRLKISELTGTRSRGASVTIDLDSLSQIVCGTKRFSSLRELVELACGQKIANVRAEREGRAAAWNAVWKVAGDLVCQTVDSEYPQPTGTVNLQTVRAEGLHAALRTMRQTGWLRRHTRGNAPLATALLKQAFELLRLLPVPPTPLAIFAAKHCGDAHALDGNQSLGRLVFKLIVSNQDSHTGQAEKKAAKRRRVWESVGLVPDELSSSVLVLNLPATGDSLCDVMLRQHRQVGMPCRLMFRELRLEPARFHVSPDSLEDRRALYVCENPSVLAAASEKFGARCPAMICVEGHPSLACWSLLETMCGAGFRLKYHGDFDWGGIRIANKIHEAFGFEPWRFTAADHRVTKGAHRKLRPPVAEAMWDTALADKIRACEVAVEEESMIDELLDDLA